MSWKLDKTKHEWTIYRGVMKQSWRKRGGIQDLTHFFVDVFVEACRHAPYTTGHVLAIALALDVTLSVVLAL